MLFMHVKNTVFYKEVSILRGLENVILTSSLQSIVITCNPCLNILWGPIRVPKVSNNASLSLNVWIFIFATCLKPVFIIKVEYDTTLIVLSFTISLALDLKYKIMIDCLDQSMPISFTKPIMSSAPKVCIGYWIYPYLMLPLKKLVRLVHPLTIIAIEDIIFNDFFSLFIFWFLSNLLLNTIYALHFLDIL